MAIKKQAPQPIDPSQLEPIELFAIRQIGKKADDLRDRLEVGADQAVDFTLRVKGVMYVAPNCPGVQSTEAPKADYLLALVLDAIGPSKVQEITPLIVTHLAKYRKKGELPELPDTATHLAEDLQRACERPCVKSRKGNVTGAIQGTVAARRPAAA